MRKIINLTTIFLIFTFFVLPAFSKRLYREAEYNQKYCSNIGGTTEFRNADLTRVDCLTKTNAIELDFAEKWAEGVGQALYYSQLTGKKGKLVLILENPDVEMKYFERAKLLSKVYNFEVEYITPVIFISNYK